MCGIAAAHLFDHEQNVASVLDKMLLRLHHRMNMSAGITTYHDRDVDPDRRRHRVPILGVHRPGPIRLAFGQGEERQKTLENLVGHTGIAQGRYATSSANKQLSNDQLMSLAQPYTQRGNRAAENFSFAFNGNGANADDLLERFRAEGYDPITETDTEVMRILFDREITAYLDKNGSGPLDEDAYGDILAKLEVDFIGAYSLVFQDGTGNLLIARSPRGERPLVYAQNNEGFYAASESFAFRDLGLLFDSTDLQPGYFMMVKPDGRVTEQIQFAEPGPRHCTFEYTYFAYVNSVTDDVRHHTFRRRQGAALAKLDNALEFDPNSYIICVPQTARPLMHGYLAERIGNQRTAPLPYEGLVRIQDYRSFMVDDPGDRQAKAREKLDVSHDPELEGSVLYIVDDSIVRGDVMQVIIEEIKRINEPREIHLRIGWDQYRYPCWDGIDTPDKEKLLAHMFGGDTDEMAQFLRVDSLGFLPIDTTRNIAADMSGKSPDDYCTACADGKYNDPYRERKAGLMEAA